ncbi:MAG: hypothetical protein D6690_16475 [Nitrospirae bacterium]|nr:MAG: hypothetical protein D6690_16475 [Nitrospirota bacterium]
MQAGFSVPGLEKELIGYIEDWQVSHPSEIHRLDHWTTEDVTLTHILEGWSGDFFLLAGKYHTAFEDHQALDTYCSVCHPFLLEGRFTTLLPKAMFWIGFRHSHSFIRVRIHTNEIIAPGEPCSDAQRALWIEERLAAFDSVIAMLDIPVTAREENGKVTLTSSRREAALFCSWPDAFGPCQFEYNSADAYEFLVPASRLAATMGTQPVTVRSYLTGFSEEQLQDFQTSVPWTHMAYRCSLHTTFGELPTVQKMLGESGRLYTTLYEFGTRTHLQRGPEASAVFGIVGHAGAFQFEIRLNQLPLTQSETTEWLTSMLHVPLVYAPLSAFP